MTGGFRRRVNEFCALLGFCAVYVFLTDVSGQPIGPTFRGQAVQEEGIDTLSRNAGKELLFYAAQHSKRGQLTNQLYSFLCCCPSCWSVQIIKYSTSDCLIHCGVKFWCDGIWWTECMWRSCYDLFIWPRMRKGGSGKSILRHDRQNCRNISSFHAPNSRIYRTRIWRCTAELKGVKNRR